MTHGPLWQRLVHGTRWVWRSPRYDDALPTDLDATVMALDARERLHAKQGRSTARVVFHGASGAVPVYLKRHYRLPWRDRLAAVLRPSGRHSPGAAEWTHLDTARKLGIAVPDAVAAGERIGPWGRLQSYLLVAELTGSAALNEVLPGLAESLAPAEFAALKRSLVAEMADITARLHGAGAFHKDLYLCHFFLDLSPLDPRGPKLTLIDLHRMAVHRWWPDRWRWKDLGQLLYSTYGVPGIDDCDRVRFWLLYRRRLAVRRPRWQRRMIGLKAARYLAHNR